MGVPGGRSGRPGGDLLFRALRRSTIGAEGFHGRVRDGIGCIAPRYGHQAGQTAPWNSGAVVWVNSEMRRMRRVFIRELAVSAAEAPRIASRPGMPDDQPHTASGIVWRLPLGTMPKRVIERLVPVSFTDCSASTPGLSTWSSTTALSETWF